jgi:hypothetical protein
MLTESNSRSGGRSTRRCSLIGLCILFGVLVSSAPPAIAQYSYNANNADEQGPGIKYFGSVKTDRGALLKGAIVLIQHEYAAVTDEQGRFRTNLPETLPGEKVDVSCSLPGYQTIRVSKRLGPHGPKKMVQVDCVMAVAK